MNPKHVAKVTGPLGEGREDKKMVENDFTDVRERVRAWDCLSALTGDRIRLSNIRKACM